MDKVRGVDVVLLFAVRNTQANPQLRKSKIIFSYMYIFSSNLPEFLTECWIRSEKSAEV
jgi:hypothetical protein